MRQEVLALAATGAAVLSGVYFVYGKSSPRLLLEDSPGPQQEEGESQGASARAGEMVAANTMPWRDRLGGGVAEFVDDIEYFWARIRLLASAFRITSGEHGEIRMAWSTDIEDLWTVFAPCWTMCRPRGMMFASALGIKSGDDNGETCVVWSQLPRIGMGIGVASLTTTALIYLSKAVTRPNDSDNEGANDDSRDSEDDGDGGVGDHELGVRFDVFSDAELEMGFDVFSDAVIIAESQGRLYLHAELP